MTSWAEEVEREEALAASKVSVSALQEDQAEKIFWAEEPEEKIAVVATVEVQNGSDYATPTAEPYLPPYLMDPSTKINLPPGYIFKLDGYVIAGDGQPLIVALKAIQNRIAKEIAERRAYMAKMLSTYQAEEADQATNNQNNSPRRMEIPQAYHKRVIGYKGLIVKRIQGRTKTKVNVIDWDETTSRIEFFGAPENIERAIEMVAKISPIRELKNPGHEEAKMEGEAGSGEQTKETEDSDESRGKDDQDKNIQDRANRGEQGRRGRRRRRPRPRGRRNEE